MNANDELGIITRCYAIRYDRTSKHSAERLWRAITDPDEVTKWMQYPARIGLRVGGDYFVEFAGNPENLDGVIVRFEHGRMLRYAWGTSIVEWQLTPEGAGTHYVFSHFGLDRAKTPNDEGVAAGWHAWLDDFEEFLSSGRPTATSNARWAELSRRYLPVVSSALGE